MDDPNITMEEYIRLEEEKARRRGKVYNWETATYGKIWCNEDVHDLRFIETEFPAIVFDDTFTFEVTLSCEPMISPLNDIKIDFRISFDESDDEDYMAIYDKNLFSYKIIYVDNLKTNSENDNDKVNMPLFSSPEPTVSYFNDLDFFIDFKNEFPSIVYNDAVTSKLDFLTEPAVSPQHIDEFDLKDETSLFECDEEEQNVLYFNDMFPFKVIYPDDSKSDMDNDDDKINIKQSSGGNVINTDDGAYAHESIFSISWDSSMDPLDTSDYDLPIPHGPIRDRYQLNELYTLELQRRGGPLPTASVSDEPHLEQDIDLEIQAEIDECIAYADALRDRGIDARVVVEAIDRDETETGVRGPVEVRVERVTHPVMPEDIPEPAQEGAVEVTLLKEFREREQGHRIVGVELAIIALTKRIEKLEKDNRRLRGTASVESQRVDRLQKMPNTRSRASTTREEFEELVTHRVVEEMEAREAARTLEPLNENRDEQEGENGGNGNGGNRGNGNGGNRENWKWREWRK
ncbi:hypothetical protein Tco_0396288 [Tanacetum coccineum]